jgi:hypothetical protein
MWTFHLESNLCLNLRIDKFDPSKLDLDLPSNHLLLQYERLSSLMFRKAGKVATSCFPSPVFISPISDHLKMSPPIRTSKCLKPNGETSFRVSANDLSNQ